MELSHKYEVEREELKQKIVDCRERLNSIGAMRQSKDNFVTAVRKFMEMETLTPALLKELIDHIDVYETEGTGKNRTQRLTIHYRFVGVVELPEFPKRQHLKIDMRQGVAIEYIPA